MSTLRTLLDKKLIWFETKNTQIKKYNGTYNNKVDIISYFLPNSILKLCNPRYKFEVIKTLADTYV